MSRYLIGVFALVLALPAMAESPSYNFFQASYQEVELDLGSGIPDVDGDGFGVAGSFEFADEWFGFVSYSDIGFDFSVDLSQLQVGVGWHTGVSDSTDFFATVSFVDAEVSASGFGSADESGYGIGIGIRSNVSDLVELYGDISYVDLGDGADGTEIGGGILFNVSDNFALGVSASFDDDVTTYGADLRIYFGD